MSRYLIIINFRTLLTLFLSFLVPFIAYEFQVVYNIDLTLMSIAIIFPLVFTIRGAFRRREKALEHLSRFKASLKTVENLFLNSKMTDELKKEGIARELVNRIQNYRKDAGFKVIDKIDIYLKSEQKLEKAVEENSDYILSETLADSIHFKSEIIDGTFIEFDNIKTDIFIKKLN